MKVAIAQIEAPDFALDQNEKKILRLIEKALDEKAELVVFPEAVNLGYFVLDQTRNRDEVLSLALEMAPSLDSPWIEKLRCQARKGIHVACGSILKVKGNRLVNALLLISPGGEVNTYFKTHLYHYKEAREESYIAEGSEISVIDTDLARIGLSICYDLNFPEVSRTLTLKGAQLIVVAAAWPKMAGGVWDTLLVARAMENEVCILAAGQIGEKYYGHSKLIDYSGAVVAEFGEEEGLKTAEIELGRQEKWRANVTLLKDRRPELYLS
jgi:predicted amidohydrolase